MLHDLDWQSLDGRRQDQRLVLFYKIINGLASVETEDILTPADSRTRKNHSFKFKHLQANCDSLSNTTSTRGNSQKLEKKDARLDPRKCYFSNRVVNKWNSLKDPVVLAPTLASFKDGLELTTY